jgi:GNAT superfamily N-acetyltransferase
VEHFEIRTLDVDDLAACVALGMSRGWEPDEVKWRLLVEAGQAFGVEDPEDGLVATVTATRYEDLGDGAVVAIGMMVVARSHERQGLGRRLMEHALDWSAGATVTLSATSMGRPLYEKLGFTIVGEVECYRGPYTADNRAPAGGVRDLRDGELAAVIRRDAAVFGADRGVLLSNIAGIAERVMVTDDLTGYAFGWRNSGWLHIGPVSATDVTSATALIDAIAAGSDLPIRLDLPPRYPELPAWLGDRGVPRAFTAPLLVYGGDLPADSSVPYAVALQALG